MTTVIITALIAYTAGIATTVLAAVLAAGSRADDSLGEP